MAGVFANIFGGAGAAGAGPAAPAPGVVTPAQIAGITNVFAGVNWNADVAQFATNAATRSIQADVQATAGSTNTSQDSLFNVPRSGFIYLPNEISYVDNLAMLSQQAGSLYEGMCLILVGKCRCIDCIDLSVLGSRFAET